MAINTYARAVMLGTGICLAAACTTVAEPDAAPATVPKAYLVAEIEVVNPEPYKAYVAAAGPLVAAYGGKYLVRGGAAEALEGAVSRLDMGKGQSFYRVLAGGTVKRQLGLARPLAQPV